MPAICAGAVLTSTSAVTLRLRKRSALLPRLEAVRRTTTLRFVRKRLLRASILSDDHAIPPVEGVGYYGLNLA